MIINGSLETKAYSYPKPNKNHKLDLHVNCAWITITEGNNVVFKREPSQPNWMDNEHRVLYEGLCVLEKLCEKLDYPDMEQTPAKHCIMLEDKYMPAFLEWWKAQQY
jgi:hypothetical protein